MLMTEEGSSYIVSKLLDMHGRMGQADTNRKISEFLRHSEFNLTRLFLRVVIIERKRSDDRQTN